MAMSVAEFSESPRPDGGSNRRSSGGARIPTVVPARGEGVAVSVSNLWPEATGSRATAPKLSSTPGIVNGSPFSGALASGSNGDNSDNPGASSSPPTSGGRPFRSGAEDIVMEHAGPLGSGREVNADGNVFSTDARPVTMLPSACTGAEGLKIPDLIKGHIANVTLPSRLALLGRQSYKIIAALWPMNLGNSVVGFAPIWGSTKKALRKDLFVLPWIFSKGGARIYMFLRILLFLVFLVFFFQFAQVWDLNIGRAWFFGNSIAIFVMYRLALIRRAPDGVIAFCRSMGAPEVEEYMFSYCWKVEADAIRTLAKAMWNNGVGVWIDVVKLTPGDEIRPMVRTMVNRVYRVVVFLSPAYIASPNCCIELHEAVQSPEKVVFCILQPVPKMDDFLEEMQQRGAVIVEGFHELIQRLDDEICNTNDSAAWKWWRKQKISGGGVPSNLVPTYWNTIPKFTLAGKLVVAPRSLTAGPVYLAGDCSNSGHRFMPPYLFFLALIAVTANFVDLYYTFYKDNTCWKLDDTSHKAVEAKCHTNIDYVWLGIMALCNLAPFTTIGSLFETRTEVHAGLRPLLASKSMNGGVKITIIGHDSDPIVQNLNRFLTMVGHNARDKETDRAEQPPAHAHARMRSTIDAALAVGDAPKQRVELGVAGFSQSITVYVMRDFLQRDALFGKEDFPFDPRTSLFVWSDPSGDPFTKDEIGERLMRFLVLVAAWDKALLAENLFSAIGVRVVDMLHSAELEGENTVLKPAQGWVPSSSPRTHTDKKQAAKGASVQPSPVSQPPPPPAAAASIEVV